MQALVDPFPVVNISQLTVLNASDPFPPAALDIIAAAGPRAHAHAMAPPRPVATSTHRSRSVAATTREGTNSTRDVGLFICCDTTPAQWTAYTTTLTAHKANVTSLIIGACNTCLCVDLVALVCHSAVILDSCVMHRVPDNIHSYACQHRDCTTWCDLYPVMDSCVFNWCVGVPASVSTRVCACVCVCLYS